MPCWDRARCIGHVKHILGSANGIAIRGDYDEERAGAQLMSVVDDRKTR